MTRHEPKSQSTHRLAVFVGALTCVSLVAGCSWVTEGDNRHKTSVKSVLSSFVLEGPELHASLRTHQLDSIRHLPPGVLPPGNPHLSTDDEFVEAIARSSSQGRLDRDGIHAVLYARYTTDESELGIYGLEAESDTDAEEREKALREIWAYNGSLNRARVHRKGLVLVVIWHDGVSPECWESVNASAVKRLNASGEMSWR